MLTTRGREVTIERQGQVETRSLRDGEDPLHVLRTLMSEYRVAPVPGLPKFYGGAVGYISFSGNLDTAITIRTIVMKDGTAHVQAGAGIVYDSVPEREHQECLNKAKALMKAIEVAEEAYVTADR